MAADMKYDNLKFSWQNEKNSLLKKVTEKFCSKNKTANVLASKDKKKTFCRGIKL